MLTTVANQQKLDKVVIVLPSSGCSHGSGYTRPKVLTYDNATLILATELVTIF